MELIPHEGILVMRHYGRPTIWEENELQQHLAQHGGVETGGNSDQPWLHHSALNAHQNTAGVGHLKVKKINLPRRQGFRMQGTISVRTTPRRSVGSTHFTSTQPPPNISIDTTPSKQVLHQHNGQSDVMGTPQMDKLENSTTDRGRQRQRLPGDTLKRPNELP
jgi:hypothetical protein